MLTVVPWKVFSYGKPSGAKFKKQNWQGQGQEKFQWFFWAWLKSLLTLIIGFLNVRPILVLEFCSICLSKSVLSFTFIFRVGRIDLSLFIAWIHSSVRRKKIVFSKVSAFFYFYFSCGKNRCLSLFIAWNTLVSKKKENLLLWTV